MSINYDYLSKIKAQISLYSSRRTTNILDGEFKSIYRGRSLDFDDLREYSPGDNVKDIDWKSSSKTGKVLIRRYVAEKKHNVLFIVDSGTNMQGATLDGEEKQQVALSTLGTIAYLVDKHGDDTALLQNTASGCDFSYFSSGNVHFEKMLARCAKNLKDEGRFDVSALLTYAAEKIKRKMVIFVITDMDGLERVSEKLLRELSVNNDVLFINVDDAYYTGDELYDMDQKRYAFDFLTKSKRLMRAERKLRESIYMRASSMLARYGMSMTSVSRESDIIDRVVELLERHRNEHIG